uniref:Zinc finger matrin-type protein 3 n=1 Tax=Lynx canadensis TaxID=61383 RepID=A0A667GS89_LYNCA
MYLLQHAGLPLPKRPSSSPPMSVAKPFGQEAPCLCKTLALEELCKPLYCKLCNVTLNSAQQAQAHYQVRKEKKTRNYKQCPPAARMSSVVEPVATPAVPVPPQMGSFKPGGRVILATENDYCKLCDASFSSPAVAQAHYQGKNHAKRLRLAEAQSNSFSESSEAGQRRTRKEGNEYKMMPNRRNMYTVQNNSAGPYFNPRSRQRIPRDLAMCVTPSGRFYCSMCNVGAGEERWSSRQHLESKQHKSKVSEQRYRNEMENLGYV